MHQSGASSSEAIAKRCCDSGWKRTRRSPSALDRGRRGLRHRAPPLQRDERLDPRVAALAGADGVAVGLALLEQPALLAPRRRRASSASAWVQPGELAGLGVHPPVRADHHRLGQVVVAPDLEVDRVVARRDLERARAELGVDALVGDHGHAALDERDDHLAADRVAVALVVGVHGDRDVGEDRRRAHRGDRDPVRRRRRRTGSGRTSACRPCPRGRPRGRRSRSGGTGTS